MRGVLLKKICGQVIRAWRACGASGVTVALIDLFSLIVAVYISYALRFSIFWEEAVSFGAVHVMIFYCGSVLISFKLAGIYQIYWLQTSVEELEKLLIAYLIPTTLLLVFYKTATTTFVVPRSVIGLLWLCGFTFLAAARLSWRLTSPAAVPQLQKRTIIAGAGEAGVILARDLRRKHSDFKIIGFLDDDQAKIGKMIAGVPVLAELEKIAAMVEKHQISDVLVALPSAPAARVRHILDQAMPTGVTLRLLPSLHELADGQVTTNTLRPVRLEDLLSRDPVQLNTAQIGSLLRGKSVMITGAGGSIGSEIVRQLLPFEPQRLVLVGHGEFSIYRLMEKLSDIAGKIDLYPVIADVADLETMRRVILEHRPQLIFHVAAHKHVPLMESNAHEAVRVNCLGTWNVAQLAGEYGAERFVMISTDKAVNPSSVMGASKRVAEMAVTELAGTYRSTLYMAVRFGNVLGSRGSVVPKFERQIAAGGPVTVTHPQMVRYFMLVTEAAGLVLQTAAIGESGKIYVLDMGQPVRIAHIAETMIRLSGCEPGRDIEIRYTGVRPGEKLFEELFYDQNHVDRTSHNKIYCARISDGAEGMLEKIRGLLTASDTVSALQCVVPEYVPAIKMC